MGTISDKLTYLNTTKTMLRDSLNKFGSNILTNDTFRSYDTKLNDIYDKLPKITQSGAGFTLENVQNGQVDDFKMIGVDLEQDTTTGKNLCELKNQTITKNGVTFIIQDGVVTANGTYTVNTLTQFEQDDNLIFNGNYIVKTFLISGTVSNTANFNLKDNSNTTLTDSTINSSMSSTFSVQNSKIITGVYAQANTVFDNFKFKVQIEEDSSSTDWEPYTGGIASPNPDYPQDIKVVENRQVINIKGKNLFDKDNAQILNGYIKDDNGIDIQRENWSYLQSYVSVLPNTTYTISGKLVQRSNDIRTYYYDNDKNWISRSEGAGGGINIVTFTTPNNCYYIQFQMNTNYYDINSIQIEENSTATDYELYYNPVSYNIDLNLENIYLAKMPDTTYKNRIYKNNGNWYFEENVKKVVLDGSEDEVWTTFKNSIILNGLWSGKPITMCDSFKETTNELWVSDSDDYRGMCSSLNTAGQFRCMPLNDMTLSDFKTWLSTHNVTLWYPLATPVTTQITNTTLINQLEAISVHTGTNIITISNSNNIIPEIEITRLKELEKLA